MFPSITFFILSVLATTGSTTALPPYAHESRATKPYQLRGVQDPIFHLYLQPLPGSPSTPVVGPEASSEYYTIGTTIQSTNSSMYLNLADEVSGKSYIPLTFNTTATMTGWALEGDTVITSTGSSYGRQLNFLACNSTTSGYYDLYLQTGSDVPAGLTCSNYQTIHTPCLC